MAPLSRLLSVFLALILMGLSLATASAGDNHPAKSTYGATVSLSRIDSTAADKIHVGTALQFRVFVRRGDHDIPANFAVVGVTRGGSLTATFTESVTASNSLVSKTIDYVVAEGDLGNAARRLVPFQVQMTFTPDEHSGNHPQATVMSNIIGVFVTKRPGSGDTSSGVTLAFGITEPDTIAVGKQVGFRLRVSTSKYGLLGNSLIIQKQLYDANGAKKGAAKTVTLFGIPHLLKGAVSEEQSQSYTLQKEDVDAGAGRVEFFYRWVVEDSHLLDANGSPTDDLRDDFSQVFTRSHFLGGAPPTPTPTPAARATATPTPVTTVVGRTSAATVTIRGAHHVHVDRRDGGRDFVLALGYLAPNGARGFNPRGYIRDGESQGRGGQTYAVVRREADQEIVRIWISPESPERGEVPWDTVKLPPYTVPVGVLSAIKLDETRPVENQLARRFDERSDGRIFVFRNNAWHWIPDIPTFEAEGFYWCDVTAADVDFFSRANIGTPLPSSGTAKDPNYPNCHSK